MRRVDCDCHLAHHWALGEWAAMVEVATIGELLVEVMRKGVDVPFTEPADFVGPFPSGAPAIFIDQVARLGARAAIVGAVGEDDFGRVLLDRLRADGVDTSGVRVLRGYTTGVAFVTYFSDGSRKFIFHLSHSAAAQISWEQVDEEMLRGLKFFHVMGSALSMSESCREACYKAVEVVKSAGGKVSLDPNLRPELLGVEEIRRILKPVLYACDLLLPSSEELELATGKPLGEAVEELTSAGKIVALKLGREGSKVFAPGGVVVDAPPFPVEELLGVVDPTGAGDCYDAAFVFGLMRGWDLEKVARFANVVGALSTSRRGPMEGAMRLEEICEFMRRAGWEPPPLA
ncbi:MAG TPA: sugar kinase [Armatimonadetes bacterium]|nr:sugar kinase [Armatimonadota bacterium]